MKKIYSIVLGAALMLIGSEAFAQLAVGAGYFSATDKSTVTVLNTETTSKGSFDGFYVGATYGIDLSSVTEGLGFEPGVAANFGFDKDDNKVNYKDFALQVPLNLKYAYELDGDLKIFALAGPALQFGLLKKSTYEEAGTTTTVDFYDGDGAGYSRFNVLIGVGAGIEFGEKFQIRFGYDFGLLPFVNEDNIKVTRPGQLKFGVAYIL